MKTLCATLFTLVVASSAFAGHEWTQWGGPTRDFRSPETGLIEKFPDGGPKTLWKRDLGEGYSSILAAGDTLYTMFRKGDDESVVALNAKTGETRWTHTYAAPMPKDAETSFGRGPNATPLLVDGKLITIGFNGVIFCLDAKTGKPIWSHDLVKDEGGTAVKFGYSAAPLLHKDTIILPVGGKGKAVMAFGIADGKVRWSSGDQDNSYSTPIFVDVRGSKYVTLVMPTEIIGLNADNGKLVWAHPYKNQWDTHCTTPVDCGKGRVFYPSFGGGVMLQLDEKGGKVSPKELWTSKSVGAGQTNVILVGDLLYGAAGSGKAGLFAAAKVGDGTEVWKERLPMANVLLADDRLIILDESGQLQFARPSDKKLDTICKATVLKPKAWTVPTLADGKLYLRDQSQIMAVDLAGR
ncbi:MAG: PQQ-binding-like beta-propeller repeat protein [Planctomycetes bacterium]|nr:PQQ-binding-like beta-propeller repeat protein [Planctomycetota bacterium]